MTKKLLKISALSILPLISAHATSITFTAEINEISVSGTQVDRTTRSTLGVVATGFFVSSSDFNAFTNNSVWNTTGNVVTTAELTAINNYLSSLSGFSSANDLSIVPGPLPDAAGVFNESLDSGAAGFHAVLLVHDSSTGIGGLGVGDHFGVVTTTYQTLGFGSESIGFNTTNSWDTFLLGQSGSLSLATVTAVPEPSALATISGLLALGWVMTRRRR
ncbi:MAG: PEP-CTERM sorting domain-containing protein [Verrucomicrobiota bacterium]